MSTQGIFYEEKGDPGLPTIVFLHGLLGSSRNWRSVCKSLADRWRVFALDLRNHGHSFHHEDVSVARMADDLRHWLAETDLGAVNLCGHSLGGKVVMRLACDSPEVVRKLAVVDIAPRDYPPENHMPTLEAMLSLDLQGLSSKKEIDDSLAEKIPNWAFRQFLLTNLAQHGSEFRWKPNLGALHHSIGELSANPLQKDDCFNGPTLFIRGGKSGYLRSEHVPLLKKYFPQSKVEILPNAGHDVQVDDRVGFLRVFESFLES